MKSEKEAQVLVFGGTSEGRSLSEYLTRNHIFHTVCVATEYGEEVMQHSEYCRVRQGRLDEPEMEALIKEGGYAVVVDATHPYAVEVSENIGNACKHVGISYLRYLRENRKMAAGGDVTALPGAIWVDSAAEAADYLEAQQGVIFLTTGSKELRVFTERISDRSRLYARVLPSAQVIASCRELGLEGRQICAMQGPFSEAMNVALLEQTKAAYLVTKDTGTTGGFPEKRSAAQKCGVRMVIIRRPEETGLDRETLLKSMGEILEEDLKDEKTWAEAEHGWNDDLAGQDFPKQTEDKAETATCSERLISCVGIGTGALGTLTHEAAEKIRTADILFGAKRILESVQAMVPLRREQAAVTEYNGKKIAAYLEEHPQYREIVILMSGDVGFYSGARGISEVFPNETVHFCCGISSVVYFASRIPTSWQDAKLLSAHGKQINLLNYVQRYPKIIMIVSGVEDVKQICGELHASGMDEVRVTVGTNLSYPEETITSGSPADFLEADTIGLHIMLLENSQAVHVITPGIPDEAFIRGKVPMTKEEIRILSVAKLQLTEDAVVYDVGAGTGSVSVECARLCTAGTVYAIERNPEGIALIRENRQKMHLSNLIPVEGLAPEAMEALPAPTHAFIGGSSGNMGQIIDALRAKNPVVRIVVNTIALESIAEMMTILKERQITDADIVQVCVSKSRTLGRYHMMTGLNPVYIISF